MKFVNVVVNDNKISVREGTTILNACSLVGVEVSRFCYHEGLSIAGNCRMCLVEIEKAPKPVASCAMPVGEGMVIKTNTDLVKKAREGVMEMLLVNHPLDCPICDQAGECDLQDEALNFGSDRGRYNYVKRVLEDKEDTGPLIKTIMTRCIHCTRCIRFAEDIAGVPVYGTTGRGEQTQVGTYIKDLLTSELSGNVIDLCPVGALTSKPYRFTARPWELKSTDTIDVLDSTCSPIRIESKGDRVLRVLPREIEDKSFLNFITDKTRFAYDAYNTQRLQDPLIKTFIRNYTKEGEKTISTSFERVTWPVALYNIKEKLDQIDTHQLDIITGPTVDLETLITLNYFQQGLNLSKQVKHTQGSIILNTPTKKSGPEVTENQQALRTGEMQPSVGLKNPTIYYPGFTYLFNSPKGKISFGHAPTGNPADSSQPSNKMQSDVENADVCLIIGADLRKEAPLLNAFVGRSVLKGTLKTAILGINALNQTYPVLHLDNNLENFIGALKQSLTIKTSNAASEKVSTLQAFISVFLKAKRPLIIVAEHVFLRPDAQIICNILALLIAHSNVISHSWIGYNVVHTNAGSIATKFVGNTTNNPSVPSSPSPTSPKTLAGSLGANHARLFSKVLYLVAADDFDACFIDSVLLDPQVFIIYQGHHADFAASIADIVLPGCLHTEKNSSFVNYKGVVRSTIPVSQPTVLAKKDWQIVAALAQIANIPFVPTTLEPLQEEIKLLLQASQYPFNQAGSTPLYNDLATAYKKFTRPSSSSQQYKKIDTDLSADAISSQTNAITIREFLIGYLLTFTLVQNSKHCIPTQGSFIPYLSSLLTTFADAPTYFASCLRKLPFKSTVSDYFLTDPITRASALMAQCSQVYHKATARSL